MKTHPQLTLLRKDNRNTEATRSIMTTIANCLNLGEAQSLQMLLEASGIASFIPDEMTAGIAPYQFFTNSGVRLQVADENAEEARRILAEEKQAS